MCQPEKVAMLICVPVVRRRLNDGEEVVTETEVQRQVRGQYGVLQHLDDVCVFVTRQSAEYLITLATR